MSGQIKKTDRLKGAEALANEKMPRLIISFAITTLIALVFNSLYTLTDALFVSWKVGDNAFGGVSVVLPFTLIQGAISTAIGGGAASLISRKLGQQNRKEAGEIAFNAMLAFYISAAVITALGFIFLEPIIKAFGVTDELYPYAKKYFIIVLSGNVFSTGFSSIIRAEGKKLYGLLIWVIPISINVALDAVFIFVCDLGVAGSALATVICQFTSFLMSVVFFCKFTSLDFKGSRLSGGRIASIIAVGLPSLIQILSISILTLLLNNVVKAEGGTLGVNTFSYVSKILTFAVVPIMAVAQAVSPIVGFNYGAKNHKRVKSCVKYALLICVVYSIFAITFLETTPSLFIGIFTANQQILAVGITALRILSASIIFTVPPYVFGAVYQAQGKKIKSLLSYASGLVFALILVFPLKAALGLNGIWLSYSLAFALSSLTVAITAAAFARQTKSREPR